MRFDLEKDVFYNKAYIELYLGEGDEIFEFEYKDGDKLFTNTAIKRPVTSILDIEMNDGYYDIETAYGYGGIYANTDDEHFLKAALEKYKQKCNDERIIAEFIRFHPFNEIHRHIGDYFDFLKDDRKVVYVDLSIGYDKINEIYGSSLRRDLRRPNESGIVFKEIDSIMQSRFTELYYATMKRVNATNFYFFNDDYFEKLDKLDSCKIYGAFHEGKLINSVILLEAFPFVYYHLAATDPEYYPLNGNSYILDQIIKEYITKGFHIFYLGGGTTAEADDSLFKFKFKFSKITTDFYIAGKIYNQEIFDKYTKKFEEKYPESIKYFLKYRFRA